MYLSDIQGEKNSQKAQFLWANTDIFKKQYMSLENPYSQNSNGI